MAEVEVIRAAEGTVKRRKQEGSGLSLERKRVAAYVRVSTDGEEQLNSFQSQKEYYNDKISKNKEWAFVGIYSDEAITGTKTAKREGFLKMIDDCMNDQIDLILTKSISRFSRNLVDTLQYVRLLKDKGIAIIFEKENINTLSMDSEMALALLSTLAQNEVESLSANVKMGLKMKMKRGELLGFNGCLGYDYNKEDKSISINSAEAETVRMIFDLYLEGYGAYVIAKQLTLLKKKNKKGEVKWTDSGIMGVISNEKYKGDMLLGKTFTVDPISKRRLVNMGEEDQFYIKGHHEPIISAEAWDKAQEIRKSRKGKNARVIEGIRDMQTRKYAFSSKCVCGFCGTKLTRRAHNQDRKSTKPVWKCRTATQKGIANCPHSKAIDESVIENAFLEAFQLLTENFDDVLESVLETVENTMSKSDDDFKVKKLDAEINTLENKRKKLTDMLLDDTISKEAYDEKYNDITSKLTKAKEERGYFLINASSQQFIGKRMQEIRKKLSEDSSLDTFDRTVFDSIVEKVIIGAVNEDGSTDPYKITFVLKGNESKSIANAKERYLDLVKMAR
ncbi:recombinase family protein [Lachnotalea glycerini]|uniref:Recombinase family protein n=1 Tax=Lachnotalea glycerini TaxID=1763509 RepID=A0A371JC49_9FIRM|nr:recombinase family protein [Lachnotalea glycerini]RDY30258.1 recombinase family protein [Lachnotalea glycerini]